MRHAAHLASALTLALAACGSEQPTGPDPGAPAEALTEREQTEHVLFHFSQGDRVDGAKQEIHYTWVAPRLGVELSGRLLYFKYRDRAHMAQLTGRSANGFAEPERLETDPRRPTSSRSDGVRDTLWTMIAMLITMQGVME